MIIKRLQEEVILLKNKNDMLVTVLNQFYMNFTELINGILNFTHQELIAHMNIYYKILKNYITISNTRI